MADGGWWLPDPTGRCDYRFRRVDGTYTDQVTNNGVPLIDPWEVATVNRRPTEPWPVGARYCWRCRRGAVAGEERCTRCGGMLTSSQSQEAAAARGRRSSRNAIIVCAVVFGGLFALFGLAALGDSSSGGSSAGESSAARACVIFRQGVMSAAGGTSTNADAAAAIDTARRQASTAATLNSDYGTLLVHLTSVANNSDDGAGLLVLAECRRLGL